MIVEQRPVPGAAALTEAKAHLRIDGAHEDALIASLIAGAVGVCEAFVGRMLLARGVEEAVVASGAWTRLSRTPVRAVTNVTRDGMALSPGAHEIDIDQDGDGWVRDGGAARSAAAWTRPGRLQVTYVAGLAEDWTGAPEALRQGVLRLAGHLYAQRGALAETGAVHVDGGPPAAVAALWQPFRRMPFGPVRYGNAR